jgi:O-antigen/teichoic acid export membrane protein
MLSCAGGIAMIAVTLGAGFLPRLFNHMVPALRSQAQFSLLLVGGSLALGLPAAVFGSIFIGLQRNEIPAVANVGSRVFGAVSLVLVALRGGTLVLMAAVLAAVNIASYCLQYALYRGMAGQVRLRRELANRAAARELFSYCYSLAIWSFSMLLVTGLDLTIVGVFDYRAVPYYAVAATLIAFITGLQTAFFSAVIPSAAILHAQGNAEGIGRMVMKCTRYNMLLLLMSGLPLVLWSEPIFRLWLGNRYAIHASLILRVLALANIVRLSATPYAVAMIGTGQQRLVTISPLAEGATNLVFSVIGAYLFGALGVALGTMIGALVGVTLNLTYNMRRTTAIRMTVRAYLYDAIMRPVLCFLPLSMVLGCRLFPAFGTEEQIAVAATGTFGALLLVWHCGIDTKDRAWFSTAASRVTAAL